MAFVLDREQLALAAGFFNGEGSFVVVKRPSGKRRRDQAKASVGQTSLWSLEQFQHAVGTGNINGPYTHNGTGHLGKKPEWRYSVYRRSQVQHVACVLWPWLSPEKKEQAHRVLKASLPDDPEAYYEWRRTRGRSARI